MSQVWRPASPSRPSTLAEVLSGCWVMFMPLLASGRAKCWRRQQAAKGWEQRKIYALPGHEAAGSHIVQLNVLLKGHGSKSKQSVKLIFYFFFYHLQSPKRNHPLSAVPGVTLSCSAPTFLEHRCSWRASGRDAVLPGTCGMDASDPTLCTASLFPANLAKHSHRTIKCILLKYKCSCVYSNEEQCVEIAVAFEISQFMLLVYRNLKRLITLALFPWLSKISFKSLFPKRSKWKVRVACIRNTQILPKSV